MRLLFFCPRWGQEHSSYDDFCNRVKVEGYDGIEAPVPYDVAERKEQETALSKYGLLLLGQYYQSFEKDFTEHKITYEKHLRHLLSAKPVKIDSQTEKDYFSLEQNKELFALAEKLSYEFEAFPDFNLNAIIKTLKVSAPVFINSLLNKVDNTIVIQIFEY